MAERDAPNNLPVDADRNLSRLQRVSELLATGELTGTASLLEEVEYAFANGKSTVLGADNEARLDGLDGRLCESHRFGAELFVLVQRSCKFFDVDRKGFEPQLLPRVVKNQLCQSLWVAKADEPHSPAAYEFWLSVAPESERRGSPT